MYILKTFIICIGVTFIIVQEYIDIFFKFLT